MQGLKGVRVVDLTSCIAGPYASKLFADAGADVIKVESAAGDPMRHWAATAKARQQLANSADDGAFFKFLNTSKRSVVGEVDDEAVRELIAGADLLIEDFAGGSEQLDRLDVEALRKQFPHLVVLSITPFGRTGDYANRPASEFTIQAECGSGAMRGVASEPPFMAGGRTTDFIGGTYAAVAASVAVRKAQQTGCGEHIDFSLSEVMHSAATIFVDLVFSMMGRPEMPTPLRLLELPSIEPTKDGWVGFNANSRQQYNDFLIMIERPDLLDDEELASHWTRMYRIDDWNEAVHGWTKKHTTDYIIEQATLFRIPVAPVNNGQTVLEHEQFKARGVFEKNPGGDFLQPRPPYKLNGKRVTEFKPAPSLGEHTGKIESRTVDTSDCDDSRASELPLKGVRVLDATAWWAGPSATHMLASLGADVIHLESIQRLDGGRTVIAAADGDFWWEQGHLWNSTNTNKRSLTLDLDSEKGMDLMKALIAKSDVVVENFSPRVFENFKLDWETIQGINPKAVFVRMPAFGLDGPWRDNLGYAPTMEQMTGLAWLTGHEKDQPRVQRGPCDPMAGMHAAFAITVALAERDATGEGQFLECTMVEGALNAAAEQVIEYTAYGHVMNREGNRSPYCAPQGLYKCRGHVDENEQWLALSIKTDEQWQAFKKVVGDPDWMQDSAFETLDGRRDAHDLMDKEISAWAAGQELSDAVAALLDVGIPAATLLDARKGYLHPQLQQRRYFEELEHPHIGNHPIASLPFQFASRRNGDGSKQSWLFHYAPTLGQHNHEILSEVLGLSDNEIATLEKEEVIGTRPLGI